MAQRKGDCREGCMGNARHVRHNAQQGKNPCVRPSNHIIPALEKREGVHIHAACAIQVSACEAAGQVHERVYLSTRRDSRKVIARESTVSS